MNTFLIVSEIIYFAKEKLAELKSNIDNIINFNMDENTLDEVLNEASYFSMFGEKKCIVVKNAKFFSSRSGDSNKAKEDSNKLLKYLENENQNTILVFIVNDKIDSKKKIYNILKEHNKVFTFPSMTKTEMKNELNKIVLKNKYKIDDNSLWYIINNSLNNFDLAINELNKIMLYYNKPCYIKYKDVINLTSKTVDDNNFKLIDSIINKDLDNSLAYLRDLKILKVEPTVIISLLYREFRLMLSILLYEKNHYQKEDILHNLKLAPWQYDKVKNNLRMYNEREIKEEIVNLSILDYKLKSGQMNKDVVLIDYLFELCS